MEIGTHNTLNNSTHFKALHRDFKVMISIFSKITSGMKLTLVGDYFSTLEKIQLLLISHFISLSFYFFEFLAEEKKRILEMIFEMN